MKRETTDFRALFESAPGACLVLAPDFTIVAVSDDYLAATKTERAQILTRGIFDVFPDNPADAAATGASNLRASLERVLKLGRPDAMAVQKYDIRRPDSEGGGFEERYWSPVNVPVLTDSARVRYIIHRVEDVTEFVRLKKQEHALYRATEELRTRAGQMELEIHRRALELQDANQRLREQQDTLESRVEARTKDLLSANEALRKSEEQLRQSQKLEAVGRLAGGIAHDFNNLLSVILTYTELVRDGLEPDDPFRAELAEIQRAGTRAAELTRQMLAFSRQQVLDPRVLDLNGVVTNVGRMVSRVLGEDIELTTVLSGTLGKVRADPGQLEQVLMNLVVNSRDAMPTGGRLTIETANVVLDGDDARDRTDVASGPYVMLAVRDTGMGMDVDTQARVFEPFFTTKEVGKGTGLGLSTVFGIVKQSGGHISLSSELRRGTTFKIYLPRVEAAAEAASATISHTEAPEPRGSETILLVEDAEQVRAVAARILKSAGYQVIEAPSPAEALLASEQHRATIDLLLTDVVMPRMNGRELAERIAATRPGIKVVFMSGYTDNIVHQGLLDSGVSFLQKPLTRHALARKVRDVLDLRVPQA